MIHGAAHPRRRRAFTLIESMATLAVLATLGSGASFLILDAVDGYTEAATSAQLHAEISIAMDRIIREVRKIELDSGASGVAPNIVGVGDTYVAWQDSDADNYSFTLSGGALFLQIDGVGGSTLLTDVSAVTVKAFNEDNTEIALPLAGAACDPVRRISVDITLTRNGVSESQRSKVFIRSTMSGAEGGG
ncbi:MAG: type II secretion system protein [Planctomycetota bacterium]|jgi:prepilin-type N-terminal cleavage/methylation domain-containing protein